MNRKEQLQQIVEILKPDDQKEQIRILVDIFNEEKRMEEYARQGFGEDELGKRKQKLFEDFRNTGIRGLFGEFVSHEVVSDANIEPVQIYVNSSRTDKHGHKIPDYASMDLRFDVDTIYCRRVWNQISVIYSSNGLVIKGKEEFDVGIDCSLDKAITKALKNPMRASEYYDADDRLG